MNAFGYIAILGRQPELGLVELESLVGAEQMRPFGRGAALLAAASEVARLGGVVKLGQVLYEGAPTDLQALPVDVAQLPMSESKTPFALSVYGSGAARKAVEAAGLSLKRLLRERGPARLIVPSTGATVTAAQLHHNRVLEDGFELLVVLAEGRMVVARTLDVQDIDWYSKRDYGRPARDAKVGMLPPKLAQVLVNTTSGSVVADPFCGSGVVLAEALLAGRRAYGSDLAADMAAAAKANLTWLGGQLAEHTPHSPALPAWEVQAADARAVALPAEAAVVSEGYLGATLTRAPAASELVRLRGDLLALYSESLSHWASQLPTGSEVSLCVPAWHVGRQWEYLGLVDELAKLGYTQKVFKHVRTPILYAREDQVVGRQLLFLRKG